MQGKDQSRMVPSFPGNLALRCGDSSAHSRMDAMNEETVKQYFDLLEDTLKELDLVSRPAQVYNVDESGMPLDHRAPNIIAKRGARKVHYCASGKKGQVTIVTCANAAGQTIPPMVIFDAKNFNHAWAASEVPGTKYGLSDKGWINTDLSKDGWWITSLSMQFLQGTASSTERPHHPLSAWRNTFCSITWSKHTLLTTAYHP